MKETESRCRLGAGDGRWKMRYVGVKVEAEGKMTQRCWSLGVRDERLRGEGHEERLVRCGRGGIEG